MHLSPILMPGWSNIPKDEVAIAGEVKNMENFDLGGCQWMAREGQTQDRLIKQGIRMRQGKFHLHGYTCITSSFE